MTAFNAITSAIFNVLMTPFGFGPAWFDLLLWPVLAGVIALLVYKKVSNQKGIADAKRRMTVHLLEVVLYREDVVGVVRSTALGMVQNLRYLGFNVVPMLVMIAPMTVVLVQLVSNYAYDPLQPGDVQLLEVALDAQSGLASTDVKASFPDGIVPEAGPVRTADGRVYWRLRMDGEGQHAITLSAGSETQTKTVVVGEGHQRVPVLRTQSWESLLYPGEPALASSSAFESIRVAAPDRDLGPFPSGESGILLWFFGASLLAGFALKDPLGVTL